MDATNRYGFPYQLHNIAHHVDVARVAVLSTLLRRPGRQPSRTDRYEPPCKYMVARVVFGVLLRLLCS